MQQQIGIAKFSEINKFQTVAAKRLNKTFVYLDRGEDNFFDTAEISMIEAASLLFHIKNPLEGDGIQNIWYLQRKKNI